MRPIVPICALVVGVAVTGCSGSSGTPTAASSPSAAETTPTESVSPSPSESTLQSELPAPSATPTPSPTASAVGGAVVECATSALRLSTGQGGAAAGTDYISLVFTNIGTTPCRMRGYPGASFVDADGHQIGVPASRTAGEPVHPVTLEAGGKASAQLGIPATENYSPSDCHPHKAAGVRAYPPDETQSLLAHLKLTVCTTRAGRSMIGPVQPAVHG